MYVYLDSQIFVCYIELEILIIYNYKVSIVVDRADRLTRMKYIYTATILTLLPATLSLVTD